MGIETVLVGLRVAFVKGRVLWKSLLEQMQGRKWGAPRPQLPGGVWMLWLWLRSGFQSPGVTVRARDRRTVAASWLERWASVVPLFNASVSPSCKR